ncbi:DNA mobilization endonuclease VirD1/MobC family subunit [Roseitranquillus sediminis]|uniref:DNA mobilization endonuclease VirD1/MobC family subunit n=1 Tax=Roseitranquillus sediminis TaxID=2809051 RepID=UPI001D0C56E0|nr:DNA mobilization endonuclease VirD1/MobC family subunit [Roseitranquillus sediminis]
MDKHDGETPDWRNRRLQGGNWSGPEATTDRPRRADKTLSVRLTEAELAEFDAQIAPLGLKRNRALRIAARRIAGFVEADAAEVAALRDATRQLGGVARNINQIARAANRTRDPDYRAFLEERAALGRELARIEARLQVLLDLATRRKDGLARLEKAAAE